MEEAAVEENATNRFFCHKCNIEITRVLDDFICPTCLDGFTEELNSTNTSSDEPSDDRSDDEMDELSASDKVQSTKSGNHVKTRAEPEEQQEVNCRLEEWVLSHFGEILLRIGAGSRNQDSRSQDGAQNDSDVHGSGRGQRSSSRSFRPSVLAFIISQLLSVRARTNSNAGRGHNTRNETNAPVVEIIEDIYSLPGMDSFRAHNDSPAPIDHMIQDFIVNLTSVGWGPMGPGGRGNGPVFFLGNPGDYAWGREGLDAIVTQLLNQMDVTGPPPLDKEKIRKIPVTVIEKEQVDSNLQCSVCWDDFQISESVRKLECEHFYHEACIDRWLELHGTCPICRKILLDDQKDKPQSNSANGSSGASGGIHDIAAILRAVSSRTSSNSPSASSSSASSTSTSHTNPSSGRPQPPPPSDNQMDFEFD